MIALSLIVPSTAHLAYLRDLFLSLQSQSFTLSFEVILALTNGTFEQEQKIRSLAPGLPLRFVSISQANIAAARNAAIEVAQGDVLLFVDEDCSLPHKNYLDSIYKFHFQNPTFAGGGFYQTAPQQNSLDLIYNTMCNTWLKTQPSPVLLGGCCFFPKKWLKDHQLRFDESFHRAGEESSLTKQWQKHGLPLLLKQDWNVNHHPHMTWPSFLKRSWVQGAAISSEKFLPSPNQIKKSFIYLWKETEKPWVLFPGLALYGFIGRSSALYQKIKRWN